MMQDTVLTMCKESVKEFVAYCVKYCPENTEIVSTREVRNAFSKKRLTAEDSDFEEMPYGGVPEADLTDF